MDVLLLDWPGRRQPVATARLALASPLGNLAHGGDQTMLCAWFVEVVW